MPNISEYWIQEISNIYEFQCIASSEQLEVDKLHKGVSDFSKEVIVKTASNKGLSRFERMLGLTKKEDHEERVNTILMNLSNAAPFTEKYLRKLLDSMLGQSDYELIIEGYHMELKVVSTKENLINMFKSELRRKIPANIGITVNILESIDAKLYSGLYIQTAETITI